MSRVYTWGLNENEKPEIVQFFVESDIKIKSVRACTNDDFVSVFYALTGIIKGLLTNKSWEKFSHGEKTEKQNQKKLLRTYDSLQ
jgi:hypothetical protein